MLIGETLIQEYYLAKLKSPFEFYGNAKGETPEIILSLKKTFYSTNNQTVFYRKNILASPKRQPKLFYNTLFILLYFPF